MKDIKITPQIMHESGFAKDNFRGALSFEEVVENLTTEATPRKRDPRLEQFKAILLEEKKNTKVRRTQKRGKRKKNKKGNLKSLKRDTNRGIREVDEKQDKLEKEKAKEFSILGINVNK
jgi:hypothetical protein